MTHGVNGMYENGLAAEALDLDGATVETGPERTEDRIGPRADLVNPHRDTDGVPIGQADAEADSAPN